MERHYIGALAVQIVFFLAGSDVSSAYDNGAAPRPPMGWSTWSTDDIAGLLDKCSEKEVLSVAEAMANNGMREAGYDMLLLDDCWSATTRNASGYLQPNPSLFPRGMRAVADAVHALGLRLGLYTCIGTRTCRGGRPGSYGHYDKDAAVMAEWTVDMVKTDRCAKPGNASDAELYGAFSKALNATGRPMVFALCNWGRENVSDWGPDVAQVYRFQMDHLPFWSFPAWAAGEGTGQGVVDMVEYVASLQPSRFAGRGAWLDADFLQTMFPLTMGVVESRTEYTFWALWSSQLLVATDPRDMDAAKRDILLNKEVIAVNQDPLGIAADRVFVGPDGTQVWARPLANGDIAGAVFNPAAFKAVTFTLDWAVLGVDPATPLRLRDLWRGEDLGVSTTHRELVVGPHEALMFRASFA